jgi:hypothetical protein
MRAIVTRWMQKPDFEGVVSGGAPGADSLAKEVCDELGVRCLEYKPKRGPEPFWVRAKARNTKIVDKVAALVALYGSGPKSPGTFDTETKARQKGIPVFVWHDGRWMAD